MQPFLCHNGWYNPHDQVGRNTWDNLSLCYEHLTEMQRAFQICNLCSRGRIVNYCRLPPLNYIMVIETGRLPTMPIPTQNGWKWGALCGGIPLYIYMRDAALDHPIFNHVCPTEGLLLYARCRILIFVESQITVGLVPPCIVEAREIAVGCRSSSLHCSMRFSVSWLDVFWMQEHMFPYGKADGAHAWHEGEDGKPPCSHLQI